MLIGLRAEQTLRALLRVNLWDNKKRERLDVYIKKCLRKPFFLLCYNSRETWIFFYSCCCFFFSFACFPFFYSFIFSLQIRTRFLVRMIVLNIFQQRSQFLKCFHHHFLSFFSIYLYLYSVIVCWLTHFYGSAISWEFLFSRNDER